LRSCGTATTEPIYQPAAPARRAPGRGLVAGLLAVVLLVVLALYVGRVSAGEAPRAAGWIAVAIAIAVVALRAYYRRR